MACLPNNPGPQTPEPGCHIQHAHRAIDAKFDSDPAHLAAVRTAIESLCTEGGFDAKATGEIGLVVNEAIEIALRDWGNGKCPSELVNLKPPDPLTPGGLGLICMHKMMDQVLFTPQPHGMLLTMRRKKTA